MGSFNDQSLDSWPINKLIPAKLSFTLGNSNLWTFIKPYHPIILARALLSTSCDPSIYFWTDRVLLVSLKYLLSHTVSTWWFQLLAWVSNFPVVQVPPRAPNHWRKILLYTHRKHGKVKNDREKKDLCWLTLKNQKSWSFQDLIFNKITCRFVSTYIITFHSVTSLPLPGWNTRQVIPASCSAAPSAWIPRWNCWPADPPSRPRRYPAMLPGKFASMIKSERPHKVRPESHLEVVFLELAGGQRSFNAFKSIQRALNKDFPYFS